MSHSEVGQVSVGKLASSYEEELAVRQRQQSGQSFLGWRSTNLALKPRYPHQPPVTNTTVTTTVTNTVATNQEPQEDSLSVSGREISEEENETETSSQRTVAPPGGQKTPGTSEIRTGRVSVSQLKNIWAGDKVEVHRNF